VWQVLPLSPTGYGNSPYSALSAFAGNPLLISLELLAQQGLLEPSEIADGDARAVNYESVTATKLPLIEKAARKFLDRIHRDHGAEKEKFESFCRSNAHWLDDYAAFSVLRRNFVGKAWHDWPQEYASRDQDALARLRTEQGTDLAAEQAIQFLFNEQWASLRVYCAERGIRILGDIAIFVNYDSADVWTHPEIFDLDKHLHPVVVSGVPPDYFSNTGQKWGNPLYRWDVLRKQKFAWWVARIRRALEKYDLIRLDHFRGFAACWEIPARDPDATKGKWVKVPGAAFFTELKKELGHLPFIAEDLGLITPDVTALRDKFNLPGMRVMQFGFGDRGSHQYLPHEYVTNAVAYTGTHDNNTTMGWWHNGATESEKQAALTYLAPGPDGIVWAMVRAVATSVAELCLFPMQDILELGSEARMNEPSGTGVSWTWRLSPDAPLGTAGAKLAALMDVTDRIPLEPKPEPVAETGPCAYPSN
jgi:4-alpha-glucanotransferase